MFWKVEGRTGLYIFFKMVCDVYGLIPEDNYTIPAEAEGIEPPTESRSSAPPMILKREPSEPGAQDSDSSTLVEGVTDHTLSTAGTTKRHRHSPSVGATSVSTVVEENEEEEEHSREEPRPVTQISESTPEEDDTTISEEPGKANDEAEPAAEPTPAAPEATHAADESEIPGHTEEKNVDPEPYEEEKKQEDPSEEQTSTETSEAEVSEVKSADIEAPEAESKEAGEKEEEAQEQKETKPDAVELEKVGIPDPAAEPLDKTVEGKTSGE